MRKLRMKAWLGWYPGCGKNLYTTQKEADFSVVMHNAASGWRLVPVLITEIATPKKAKGDK